MWPMQRRTDLIHAEPVTDTGYLDDPEARAPMTLLLMMTGYWISQAVHVVAKLDVADALTDGPRTSDELAASTGANRLALGRVMRALASVDVFRRDGPDRWALAPLGDLLRTDRPGSMRPLALMYGEEQYAAWAGLEHSVTSGAPRSHTRSARTTSTTCRHTPRPTRCSTRR